MSDETTNKYNPSWMWSTPKGIIMLIFLWPFMLVWYTWAKSGWSQGAKILITVLTGVILITAMGSMGEAQPVANKDQTNKEAQSASEPAPSPETPAPAEPPKPTKPYSVISEGVWEVNVDIKPGVYKTEGGPSCYYSRMSSYSDDDIIDNDISSGPSVVEVKTTDKVFKTNGCADWILQ